MRGGWDTVDLCRRRRFRFLLNLVDHLPRDSAYGQAIADDDELAAAPTSTSGSSAPAVAEWSPEVELLAAVYDRIGELIAVQTTAPGKTVKPPKPWPRPLTAADRARTRQRQDSYENLKRKLFPDGR